MSCRQNLSVEFIEIKGMGREERMGKTESQRDEDTERRRDRQTEICLCQKRREKGVGRACPIKGPLYQHAD